MQTAAEIHQQARFLSLALYFFEHRLIIQKFIKRHTQFVGNDYGIPDCDPSRLVNLLGHTGCGYPESLGQRRLCYIL
ncbi:hypothetical protein [Bifidobacterium indicum]|uniref:hypothetical protein n=1 Tax=Bifidobacterium indicum TaxID=1691 RepID=UPI0030DD78B7